MSNTLIDVINECMIETSQRGNKTAIAETDSTEYFRQQINNALTNVYSLNPTQVDVDGTVTLPASTRTVNPPTGLEPYRIYSWSWRINNSAGDIPIDFVTEEFMIENYPLYESFEDVRPRFVYITNGILGFYPLLTTGSSSLTIQFKYPAQFTKLTSASATFPFPDQSDELLYVKWYAVLHYELLKGLGQPGVTNDKVDDYWARMVAKYKKGKRAGITGHRKYG